MTTISLNIPVDKIQENANCHLLPCKINYSGACNVSNYFTPYIREQGNHLTCSVRGHPLKGQKIKIPDSYIGVVLKENKNLSISDDKRDLKKVATFKEFTSWNWDIVPSPQDKLVKALQWINLASILHKPVTEYADDIKESSKSQVKRKFNQIDNS
ncbi:uncharacterized protein TNIN_403671 [Trichonephila inaurata madagascariensis]|uniref:Uncharacterized protein n=1 Tax=Trichonephila inaurata madagascariensis TaxID=2747483 RepID=A0A8X6Y1N7_9ARAC|nr:uncharacterized protein TNIN_403671 [Trichonephila inaurata madagascariensis]